MKSMSIRKSTEISTNRRWPRRQRSSSERISPGKSNSSTIASSASTSNIWPSTWTRNRDSLTCIQKQVCKGRFYRAFFIKMLWIFAAMHKPPTNDTPCTERPVIRTAKLCKCVRENAWLFEDEMSSKVSWHRGTRNNDFDSNSNVSWIMYHSYRSVAYLANELFGPILWNMLFSPPLINAKMPNYKFIARKRKCTILSSIIKFA